MKKGKCCAIIKYRRKEERTKRRDGEEEFLFSPKEKIIDLRKEKYPVKQGKANPKGEAKFKIKQLEIKRIGKPITNISESLYFSLHEKRRMA